MKCVGCHYGIAHRGNTCSDSASWADIVSCVLSEFISKNTVWEMDWNRNTPKRNKLWILILITSVSFSYLWPPFVQNVGSYLSWWPWPVTLVFFPRKCHTRSQQSVFNVCVFHVGVTHYYISSHLCSQIHQISSSFKVVFTVMIIHKPCLLNWSNCDVSCRSEIIELRYSDCAECIPVTTNRWTLFWLEDSRETWKN